MKFKSINTASHGNTQNIHALLATGSRLAAILPLYVESRAQHPLTRLASLNVIRAQVRQCIAALGNANGSDLATLRARLSQGVKSIHDAPNEATARALYESKQVQETLWVWATAEASIFVRSMTRRAPIDADKQADIVGDAVMGFMRETSERQGHEKLNPFSMARTWEPARMADPLGTLRKYLHAWAKNVVQRHNQQQIHEGVSLDAPAGGSSGDTGQSFGEMVEDNQAMNPEVAILDRDDLRSQIAAMTATYERQVAGLENDIRGFENRTDAYSVGQKAIVTNRLNAIKEMVAPLLQKLQRTSEILSATEVDHSLNSDQRERRLADLNRQFETAMSSLTAISEAQERAHGKRINREEQHIQALQHRQNSPAAQADNSEKNEPVAGARAEVPSYKNKKPISDPLTTERAYARARENAERLLPNLYRSLLHRKNSDLSQKYTAGLITNWKLLDGIDSQHDLDTALSPDSQIRAAANVRSLFSTVALKMMLVLRDQYTYDEKNFSLRQDENSLPKNARQRFILLMGQEIERDPVLHTHTPQLLDLLKDFVLGNGFRTLWETTDYIARAGAYEWARNEKIDKRWSDLSSDDINTVANEAGTLLYDNQHRPFAASSQGDAQHRVTRDLDLTPAERQEIMRQEVARINRMMRGDIPRGAWAHSEPVEGGRFHDKPRVILQLPSTLAEVSDPTISTSSAFIARTRRFASKYN